MNATKSDPGREDETGRLRDGPAEFFFKDGTLASAGSFARAKCTAHGNIT